VPMATVEKVLALYREKYFDLNVQHFHEKLGAEHGIELSYTWVKQALQGAGLVARARKRGAHRKRRARRPLPGMLLHIDGSRHQWFQDERWYDLIVILDDATSEIYYAQLVEEESTATVMAGLKEVIERKGVFCALYSDRGSHFWLTPKVGGKVDSQRRTQVGRALHDLGVQRSRPTRRKRGGAASAASRPGRGACHRSCGCASLGHWRRRTGFCGKLTSPSSIAVFRSRPRSVETPLSPVGVVIWNGPSRCSSNAA